MDQIISFITMIGGLISITLALCIYIRDTRRKAKQDTIEAYNVLQNDVLSKINRLTPSEVRKHSKNSRSEEYKQITEYLMAVECFCIGLDKNIYDFNVFYDLTKDYFNDKTGSIRPTLEPMMEEKIKQHGKNYYPTLKKTWDKMDKRRKS